MFLRFTFILVTTYGRVKSIIYVSVYVPICTLLTKPRGRIILYTKIIFKRSKLLKGNFYPMYKV